MFNNYIHLTAVVLKCQPVHCKSSLLSSEVNFPVIVVQQPTFFSQVSSHGLFHRTFNDDFSLCKDFREELRFYENRLQKMFRVNYN